MITKGVNDIESSPPAYEECVGAPLALPSGMPGASSSTQDLTRDIFLYYQLFEDGLAVPVKCATPDSDEPTVGRVRMRDIAPPHTILVLKRAVAKAESIDRTRVTALFALSISTDGPLDDTERFDLRDGPGRTPDAPIALVLGTADTGRIEMEVSSKVEHSQGVKHSKGRRAAVIAAKTVYFGVGLDPYGALRCIYDEARSSRLFQRKAASLKPN